MLPNAVLQYRKPSYTARGLLVDLLSRPDGWREDGRHTAATSPQGRGAPPGLPRRVPPVRRPVARLPVAQAALP
ncbi:hypothetical protein AB0C76_21765 [Kitasatospora sp. NPDC048722]|uniref:hypothetical protein n=1 Tax=Kitasatospora sp. NPDC048722 TaxID=3155639 RepID=UPI0033DA5EF6